MRVLSLCLVFASSLFASDPYGWLEEMDAPRTKQWLSQQEQHASDYFSDSARKQHRQQLERIHSFDSHGVPTKRKGLLFYTKETSDSGRARLYIRMRDGQEHLLVEPKDGWALSGFSVSPDATLIAYGQQEAGSDWAEWTIRSVLTGEDVDGPIKWIKFQPPIWDVHGEGLFYVAFAPPEEGSELVAGDSEHRLYYHQIGDAAEADRLLARQPQGMMGNLRLADEGQTLVFSRSTTGLGDHSICALSADGSQEIIPDGKGKFHFIGESHGQWLFHTNAGAPNWQVIALDPKQYETWDVVVSERQEPLVEAIVAGGKIAAVYLRDVASEVRIYDGQGNLEDTLALPGKGTVSRPWRGMALSGDPEDVELFVPYADMTHPTQIFSYNFHTKVLQEFFTPSLTWDPDAFEVLQVFYESFDGTQVPLFLLRHRDTQPDPETPTLLYGYGGFGLSMTPYFEGLHLAFAEAGGIVAVANIRGGGEYGEEWHRAGMGENKQTVFNDFIAAATWLIDRGYTSPERLAIYGRSNGGLLVGACMTQRPELIGAAVVGVGVLDMLRFHLFTCGANWMKEYGSPEIVEEAEVLRCYSPYHNIDADCTYPATLVVTSDHDDRVVPLHSYKFAARLQEASGDRPVVLRVAKGTGHSGGAAQGEKAREEADILSFLMKELGFQAAADAQTEPGESKSSPAES